MLNVVIYSYLVSGKMWVVFKNAITNSGWLHNWLFPCIIILFSWEIDGKMFEVINTIIIKWSENKQLPGASRSGRSQWEKA